MQRLIEIEPLLEDGHEHVGGHDDPYLAFGGVLGSAEELLDAQVLLDPFEEQLHLPSALVEGADTCLSVLGRKLAFPNVSTPKVRQDDDALVFATRIEAQAKPRNVQFCIRRGSAKDFRTEENWYAKDWTLIKAHYAASNWQVKVPAVGKGEQLVAYSLVEDESGVMVSSRHHRDPRHSRVEV